MSMFNKFAVMIAFAVCTTNAWAGQCKKQRVLLKNNVLPMPGIVYFDEDKISDTVVDGYLCDESCDGVNLVLFDNIARMDKTRRYPSFCIIECKNGEWDTRGCEYNFDEFVAEVTSCYDIMPDAYLTPGIKYNGIDFRVIDGSFKKISDKFFVADGYICTCGSVGQRECDGDYKFYVCETDADCDAEHLPSHATAGHCVSAGRSGYKVCTATDCGENYELAQDKKGNSMGWCRKKSADKNEKSDTDENSGGGQGNIAESNNGESESGTTTSTTVFDDLDKFISEKFVGSSVWKNDEGNFNTARLVSDSVAGVVLGTVGGVITSHIIKKNQIENGFDDLKCTIGGQTVASYGDEFRVGVK